MNITLLFFYWLHLDWFGLVNHQKFMHFIFLAFGVLILNCKLGVLLYRNHQGIILIISALKIAQVKGLRFVFLLQTLQILLNMQFFVLYNCRLLNMVFSLQTMKSSALLICSFKTFIIYNLIRVFLKVRKIIN